MSDHGSAKDSSSSASSSSGSSGSSSSGSSSSASSGISSSAGLSGSDGPGVCQLAVIEEDTTGPDTAEITLENEGTNQITITALTINCPFTYFTVPPLPIVLDEFGAEVVQFVSDDGDSFAGYTLTVDWSCGGNTFQTEAANPFPAL